MDCGLRIADCRLKLRYPLSLELGRSSVSIGVDVGWLIIS